MICSNIKLNQIKSTKWNSMKHGHGVIVCVSHLSRCLDWHQLFALEDTDHWRHWLHLVVLIVPHLVQRYQWTSEFLMVLAGFYKDHSEAKHKDSKSSKVRCQGLIKRLTNSFQKEAVFFTRSNVKYFLPSRKHVKPTFNWVRPYLTVRMAEMAALKKLV